MPVRLKIGDLIKIPLTDKCVAVGQVVLKRRHGLMVLAVFPATDAVTSDAALCERSALKPDLVVETFDILVGLGQWKLIGKAPVASDVPIPVYVVPVGLDRVFHIQDINGNVLRRATDSEAKSMRMPKSFSAALVEDAIRAANGLGEWLPNYDDMRPDWEHTAAKILE